MQVEPQQHSKCLMAAPLTFSVTVGTHRLHLLDHSRGQLSDHDAHATPPTRGTLLNSACLASLPAHT